MKKTLSLAVFAQLVFALVVMAPAAHAAKFADGTATWDAAAGMAVVFTPASDLVADDEIVVTFPSEAPVSSSFLFYSPGDEPVEVIGQTSAVSFARNTGDNSITVTLTSPITAGTATTMTFDTRVITGYTSTNFAQQSVAINTVEDDGSAIDYGVALITNDNTTEVTATVPLFVTMAVDDVTMDLGTLSVATVKESSQTYTVNSNNRTGVQVQVASDGDLRDGNGNVITAVADGTVTAGNEEYGVAISNISDLTADAGFATGENALPTSETDLIGNATSVANGTFDIDYKAAISGTTVAGEYTQTVTVTIATNA